MQKQIRDSTSAKTETPSFYSQTKLIIVEQFENGRPIQKCSIGKYRYSKQDVLGQGFSSTVYKATLIDNKKQRFAIKVIDLSKFQGNQIDLLETEIEIIRSLNHPNIIKCIDVYKTEVNYFLVTQYCPHGDLSQLIKIQKSITEDRAIPIMRQILEGYKYLMSKNIIHRDLKPANVMRFSGNWKIGDFGFAKYCKQQFILEKLYVGTPLYMPPESLQLNKYSYKSDIFGLGIILYEMLTGETPWVANDQKQLLNAMKENKLQIPQGIVSEQVKEFLRKSIQIDYYTRMNKQQFKKFTLENVDVDKIAKVRPGRGMSPGLRRQMSKSGKKSFLFVTPIKSSKNPCFQFSASRHSNQVQSSKNYEKYPLQLIRNNLMAQYGLGGSPIDTKIFKQNSQTISNETDLVKVMVNFVNESSILKLAEQDRKMLCIFMYRTGLKILKMASNSRQNTYKLSKWDIYRKSQKFLTQISVINSYTNKVQNQYATFKKLTQPSIITQFHNQFPELEASGSISFKVFARLYQKLRKFIKQKIIGDPKQVGKQNVAQFCYAIKLLINIVSALKSRTTREQQIMGFGLKVKPQSLLMKNISWSVDAMKLSLKQLDSICQYRVELQ